MLKGGQAGVYIYDDGSGSTINWGLGNIDSDPLFGGSANGDYRLSGGSLCIDAGDNSVVPAEVTTDINGLERIVDGDCDGTATVDMGAYELVWVMIGDFEGDDCDVDLGDVSVLSANWGLDNPTIDIAPFRDPDGVIDLGELLVVAGHWLEGVGL